MDQNHPGQSELNAFRERRLSPSELLEISDHVGACADCRAAVAASAAVESFLGEDVALHLSEDELAMAAEDRSLLHAEARSHFESCAACQAEAADLRAFHPRPVAVMPTAAKARVRVIAWPAWAAAAAAAAIVAVLFLHMHSASAPVMVAELHDRGGTIGLDAQGRLSGIALTPQDAELVSAAMREHRLPVSAAAVPATERMRGANDGGPAFAVRSPLAETTLLRPEFRWQPLAGALGYQVFVYDEAFQPVAQSTSITATAWTPEKPLAAGAEYVWVVKATTREGVVQSPRPPQAEARFRTASAGLAARIADAQTKSHLLLAALYASNGMTTLARAEVEALERQNSGSALVEQLKASLPPPVKPQS